MTPLMSWPGSSRLVPAIHVLPPHDRRSSPGAPFAIAEVATLSSVPLSKDAAERRQLTVMFCALVGSTAMSAWLDPQDKRGIIGAFVP
jgi:class 3 adenylate cyclase